MLPVSWRQYLPVWIFDGSDWCETAWLQLGVADVFEGSLCQWMDSVVTWVASYWLISLLIGWLQPPRLSGPASRQFIKYLYKAGKDQDPLCPVLHHQSSLFNCLEVASPFLFFFFFLADSVLNIAHILFKPSVHHKIQRHNSQHAWNCSPDSACPTESALRWTRGPEMSPT